MCSIWRLNESDQRTSEVYDVRYHKAENLGGPIACRNEIALVGLIQATFDGLGSSTEAVETLFLFLPFTMMPSSAECMVQTSL